MKQSLTRSEVEDILKNGRRAVSDTVKMVYKKDDSEKEGYAVLVPKKKVKKAVERNRIRRIIREAVRETDMPIPMFVILYTGGEVSHTAMKESMKHIAEKIAY